MLPASQFVDRGYGLARAELRSGGWLAVSQTFANEKGLRVGSFFNLASPQPLRFRVAGITTNLGWSPGAITMNPADFARAWGSNDVSAYEITLRPGVSLPDGIREVKSVVGGSGLVVQTAAQHEQNDLTAQRQGLERLRQISVLVLVLAAVAMAIAIAAMIWQRRPRLAGMKVDGFAQRELWRALLWETTLLLAIGCAIGAAFGLYGQQILSHALAGVSGFPVIFSVSVSTAALSVSVVVAIAFLIVALPGYMAAQVKPALQD
jgi:putative ABC transport system permease protein